MSKHSPRPLVCLGLGSHLFLKQLANSLQMERDWSLSGDIHGPVLLNLPQPVKVEPKGLQARVEQQ